MLNNYIKKLPERRYAPQEFVYMGLHLLYSGNCEVPKEQNICDTCDVCNLNMVPIQTCGNVPCYIGMHWKIAGNNK